MISKPTNNNIDALAEITSPVEYSSEQGLALLLSNTIVSSSTTIPYTRIISTTQFKTGNYDFSTPSGYTPTPYTLPILEPKSWEVFGDSIDAYIPVASYQIGHYTDKGGGAVTADLIETDFPIIINPTDYTHEGVTISPLALNQSVTITLFKEPSVKILWDQSNVLNNGMPDEGIVDNVILRFVITNLLGVYYITDWIMPSFLYTDLEGLRTTNKSSLSSVINEVYDKCNIAGGDLQGLYPNPIIKNNAVTTAKISNGAIDSSKIKIGGIISDNIGVGEVKDINIAAKSISSGAFREGSVTSTALSQGCVTSAKLASNCIAIANFQQECIPESALRYECVTTEKLKDRAVDSTKIKIEGILSENIGVGQVQEINIAPGSVWRGAYKDKSIYTNALSAECVTPEKIQSDSIGQNQIETAGVGSRQIAAGAVDAYSIRDKSITSAKLSADIAVPYYDYVVDSDAALAGLHNNTTAVNVLIKKGVYISNVPVFINKNVKTIIGEGGNHLLFTSPVGGDIDGLVNNYVYDGTTNPYTQYIHGVNVTAERFAFNGFYAVYNCNGVVSTSSSAGNSPFYKCNKVINCNCLAATDGGKTFSTNQCYNVRGCTRKTGNNSSSIPYYNSYSGSTASSTYACADTPNGGWNS